MQHTCVHTHPHYNLALRVVDLLYNWKMWIYTSKQKHKMLNTKAAGFQATNNTISTVSVTKVERTNSQIWAVPETVHGSRNEWRPSCPNTLSAPRREGEMARMGYWGGGSSTPGKPQRYADFTIIYSTLHYVYLPKYVSIQNLLRWVTAKLIIWSLQFYIQQHEHISLHPSEFSAYRTSLLSSYFPFHNSATQTHILHHKSVFTSEHFHLLLSVPESPCFAGKVPSYYSDLAKPDHQIWWKAYVFEPIEAHATRVPQLMHHLSSQDVKSSSCIASFYFLSSYPRTEIHSKWGTCLLSVWYISTQKILNNDLFWKH